MIQTMIHGFFMALADSVPGVSGGTIAFIMGFYDRFLAALHEISSKEATKRKAAFFYLAKFAVGWGVGMGGSILLLSRIFESNVYFLSSLFMGLTLAAIPFIVHQERNTLKNHYSFLLYTLLGIAFVVLLSIFRANSMGIGAINFQNLEGLQYLYIFISGALAISAMLLPGVSGSTMLLILGVYIPAIKALEELMRLQTQYLPGILVLVAGVLVGIIFAARAIRSILRRFRPQMMYLILGLLIGSLYAISMGPTTLDNPQPPLDTSTFSILAFIIGIAILVGLELMKYLPFSQSNR